MGWKPKKLVLPGHRYTGPGNSIVSGKPTNHNDAVSRNHDLSYNIYGPKAYKSHNEADDIAVAQWKWNEYGGALGKTFFKAKKLAWHAGMIGSTGSLKEVPFYKRKRLRGAEDPTIEPAIKKIATRDRSLANLQPQLRTNAMAGEGGDGKGSGNDAGLKETPIDNVHDVHRGPPDYSFASLPYVQLSKVQETQRYSIDFAWRMTSPYDPFTNFFTSTVAGTATGTFIPQNDPDGTQDRAARWFRYYAGVYKYYHVVSCRYNIYIENLSGEPLYCHLMFYNEQLPPTGATNEDMMLWKDTRTQILGAAYKAVIAPGIVASNETATNAIGADTNETDTITNAAYNFSSGNHVTSRGGHTSCVFSGEYRPGDFNREIILDSQVENWTLINTNPILPERLLLRLKPENPGLASTGTGGDLVSCKIRTELNYLVEFKELQDGLRWPVSRQPLQVAIDQNIFSTTS